MRAHPEIGEQLIRRISAVSMAAGAVRHHHERVDGAGYPDGLVGRADPDRGAGRRRQRRLQRDDVRSRLHPRSSGARGARRASPERGTPPRPPGRRGPRGGARDPSPRHLAPPPLEGRLASSSDADAPAVGRSGLLQVGCGGHARPGAADRGRPVARAERAGARGRGRRRQLAYAAATGSQPRSRSRSARRGPGSRPCASPSRCERRATTSSSPPGSSSPRA